jgi:hypothetical protein
LKQVEGKMDGKRRRPLVEVTTYGEIGDGAGRTDTIT